MAELPVVKVNMSQRNELGVDYQAAWWNQREDQIHAHVFPLVKKIKNEQSYREKRSLLFARLYSNLELLGLTPASHALVAAPSQLAENRVTLNVVAACVDTATSKMGKVKTRPIFLTENGNWSKRDRAKKLTNFLDGWFDEAKVYRKGIMCFRDGTVWGTGAIKLYKEDGKVHAERVIESEIVVDDSEGMYGEPRQIHQVKHYHREVLLEMFKDTKNRSSIVNATNVLHEALQNSKQSADLVEVVESWHLPSHKDANDGAHTICISNQTLFHEKWEKSYFPIIFFRWKPRLVGFFGLSMTEEIVGIQLEINKLLRDITKAHKLFVPQVWLENSNMAVIGQMNNEIGGVRFYTGQPPLFQTPAPVNPQTYQHLENLWNKAFAQVGISALSAASQKPAGISADVALRTLQDIESERFMQAVQSFEDFYMDIADVAIDMMEDLAKKDDNLSVNTKDGKGIDKLFWRDASMSRDDYVMRKFPTSALPSTPAGKMQTVQEWVQAGWVDQEDAMSLLDFPDTEKFVSIKIAGRETAMMMVDRITEGKEYMTPEPELPLEFARNYAQTQYLNGVMEGLPESRLELLQRFRDDCQAMIDVMSAGQQQPQPPMEDAGMSGAEPLGVPEQAPVSELLPVGGGQPIAM